MGLSKSKHAPIVHSTPAEPEAKEEQIIIELSPSSPKRMAILHEIVDTERSYLSSLQACLEYVMVPLKKEFEGKLDPILTRRIFGKLEDLEALHKNILRDMQKIVAEERPQLGPLFLEYAERFKLVYTEYVNCYDDATTSLATLSKDLKGFNVFIQNAMTREEFKGLSLLSILIMPIQRLPRYVLLLTDLLKNTEDEHSDYEAVKECLQSIKEVANFINEEKRMLENMQVLTELQLSLYDPQNTMSLVLRGRELLWKGSIYVKEKKRDYKFFLFNDMILIARKYKRDKIKELLGSGKHLYKEKERCQLVDTIVRNEKPDSNQIYFKGSREWHFEFKKLEMKNEWLTMITNANENAKKNVNIPRPRPKPVLRYEISNNNSNEKNPLIPKDNRECCGGCSLM